ncbi:multidrug DMT transporter permease [Pandoraea pneumonica]|jgi:drug/metabolite transporter (DMT)-like permease|uniref:Multidrug DMT transporter permease n=1 Tax=Pandoraea pneumonica TaxID=2508299 RepID=A0A5E4XAZ8_9BURK|nr:DMT family transporter [Pandoraea pneumonica]VVE33372.1 multidrug DMT transporter permease [Pandoraea pneumonica]
MNTAPRPIDATALAIMVGLCAIWGGQQVAVKLAVPVVPAVLQAGLRSVIATLLVGGWMLWRRQRLITGEGTLPAGILAGVLFSLEFLCIFVGLTHTTASRMAVFLYSAPCFTAIGLHWTVPSERLRTGQWLGMALAFCGIVVAFSDGGSTSLATTWPGDLLGILAGVFWGMTTVVVRASKLATAAPAKTLLYQLSVSAVLLCVLALATGNVHIGEVTTTTWISLIYQSIGVAFASYLIWFWMLTRYSAARLASFSFLSPLFGVTFGVLILGESVGWRFAGAVALVFAGISLVNRRR